jgi:hypothetical protein
LLVAEDPLGSYNILIRTWNQMSYFIPSEVVELLEASRSFGTQM